jgi:hypothetical protein
VRSESEAEFVWPPAAHGAGGRLSDSDQSEE